MLQQNDEGLRLLLEATRVIPWEADAQTWRFTSVGPQAVTLLGYPVEAWYQDDFWAAHIHPEDRDAALEFCLKSSQSKSHYTFQYRMVAADGRLVWMHDVVSVQHELGQPRWLRGVMLDITEHKQAETLLHGEKRMLEMMAEGHSLRACLEFLVRRIEEQAGNAFMASIWLLDSDGVHLRAIAAGRLPAAYKDAAERAVITPSLGSCGQAIFTRKQIIVSDIAVDPLWQAFKELALHHGLRASWSTPIVSSTGTILGTFAIYYPLPRQPSSEDLRVVQMIAHTTAVIIERDRAAHALREREIRLQEMVADLERSRASLQEKIAELETFHDLAVNRELRMMELKRENQKLQSEVERLSRGVTR